MRISLRMIISWVLVVIYAGLIFMWSSFSEPPLVPVWKIPNLDKLYHAIEYAVLGILLISALRVTFLKRSDTRLIVWGMLLAILYGLSDELHQASVPGREMSGYDLMADAAGAGAGGLLWGTVRRHYRRSSIQ